MTAEEAEKRLEEDPQFMRSVARSYLVNGDFYLVDVEHELDPGTLEDIIGRRTDLRQQLGELVDTEFHEEQKMASRARVRKALKKLAVTMDAMDDPSTCVKAALGILNFDIKFLKEERKEDEEDDLDKLWKEVTSECKTKKNTKDSKGDSEQVQERPDRVD